MLIILLSILIIVLAKLFYKSKNKVVKVISAFVIAVVIILCSVSIFIAIEQERVHREFHNTETNENIILK